MLLLTNVYLNVIRLRILANDHTLIYGGGRTDEQGTSVLRLIKTVGGGNALLGSHERGGESGLDFTAEGLVACKNGGNKTFATCVGEKLTAVTEKASCGLKNYIYEKEKQNLEFLCSKFILVVCLSFFAAGTNYLHFC